MWHVVRRQPAPIGTESNSPFQIDVVAEVRGMTLIGNRVGIAISGKQAGSRWRMRHTRVLEL